jgi:signal transduction histidine kinase
MPWAHKVARLRRHLWPDRIATRIALIMVTAMLLTQIFGYLIFLGERNGWWPQSSLDPVVERLHGPIEAAFKVPFEERAAFLAHISATQLTAHRSFTPVAPIRSLPPFDRLQDHFLRRLPGLVDQVLVEARLPGPGPDRGPGPVSGLMPGPPLIGFSPPMQEPVTLWLRLADRTWLSATMPLGELLPPPPFYRWTPWLLGISTIILISLVAARGISRSLRRLSGAAEHLGMNMAAKPLAERGPHEVRAVTRAFNQMQARLQRFVEDRTRMLAAISHDLRTPLSRLRLRAENLPPHTEKGRILADLDLMDRMIAATLTFARDDVAGEKRVKLDLASLLQAVCDETVDAGGRASYQGPIYLAVDAAPLSLMRAITNVVENAVKYGGVADATLVETPGGIEIQVRDAGPGIPAGEIEHVFEPFYRLDPARSPTEAVGSMGGSGLGLAIARHVFRAHGGDIELVNAPTGGLIARMTLPRAVG